MAKSYKALDEKDHATEFKPTNIPLRLLGQRCFLVRLGLDSSGSALAANGLAARIGNDKLGGNSRSSN